MLCCSYQRQRRDSTHSTSKVQAHQFGKHSPQNVSFSHLSECVSSVSNSHALLSAKSIPSPVQSFYQVSCFNDPLRKGVHAQLGQVNPHFSFLGDALGVSVQALLRRTTALGPI